MLPYNMLKRYDSGQAGMTDFRYFATFYETAIIYSEELS